MMVTPAGSMSVTLGQGAPSYTGAQVLEKRAGYIKFRVPGRGVIEYSGSWRLENMYGETQ